MISYEKVRQSLKTLNMTVIVLNIIGLVFSVIGIASLYFTLNNEQFKATIPPEQLDVLKQSLSPFNIFMMVISLGLTIAIIVLAFQNRSKIAQDLEINYMPYFLGLGSILLSIVQMFLNQFSLISFAINLALASLYFFSYLKAKTLNEKEDIIDA
ncbi:hypothetical protein DIX60_08660 [Streptococcus iniae]|uniref:hypothetical protein n=1 Tax=Streptococcus iniae TaxID=1346 RepID=UPI0008DA5DC5|nr:hypothetical protein [Streptococcus iniae]OHX26317.1 hypothetical protein BKX95_11030 [Streptococcus iniae]RLV27133.1 hypothetical protein DIX60_08660 [Streptococcus iniae]